MNSERIKKIFIYMLIVVNIGLFYLNYQNRQKYILSSANEKAVYQVLSENGIGMYTDIIKHSYPMRQLSVSIPSFDNDMLKKRFFDSGENVKISLEFDRTMLVSDNKNITLKGNSLYFSCPDGTGEIKDFSKKTAEKAANDFIQKLVLDKGNEITLEKITSDNENYTFVYSESFKSNKLFCSNKSVTVAKTGIVNAEAKYYTAIGFWGLKQDICSCDEALLTMLHEIKKSGSAKEGMYVENIELGYDFEDSLESTDITGIRLVPCYRIYVSGIESPFIINAYTNSIIGH
ncbi:MAG: two-component system regulatory protein YycI [Clostridia bacterium]|jgi:regulatory protein YycI of two-component signal transduction system YycFG|nr:two-component system regulatory protein YycI [Clostridia bacterium]